MRHAAQRPPCSHPTSRLPFPSVPFQRLQFPSGGFQKLLLLSKSCKKFPRILTYQGVAGDKRRKESTCGAPIAGDGPPRAPRSAAARERRPRSHPTARFPFPSVPFQRLQFLSAGASKSINSLQIVAKNFREFGLSKGCGRARRKKTSAAPTAGAAAMAARWKIQFARVSSFVKPIVPPRSTRAVEKTRWPSPPRLGSPA